MCDLDVYRRTKLHLPMLAIGIALVILSCFIITMGIARAREDIWIAGILLAIVAGPLFVFSLLLFCIIKTDSGPVFYRKQYVVGRVPFPAFTSIPSALGPASMSHAPSVGQSYR